MTAQGAQTGPAVAHERRAHGPWSDLALHTIGWRAFQDLCSQVCEVALSRPVEIFREAQDGGQDAVFLISSGPEGPPIGTVQCKHTSEAGKPLKVADLTAEIGHVEELVKAGQADTYAFMTNMSVDAPVAAAMRDKLRSLGVRKPHILGRQYIVRVIRSSARLRALVPQVYGLGDLTSIVDERLSEQSRALLDSWIPKLRTYVPTQAHRDAVNAISDHGVVLLLGNPSSGKSAIGAIVSTIASENPDNTVLALTSPRDFEAGWNPNDPGRFFWIDDAFGSNVLRDDYVQDWASAFSKLRAAIKHGNRFLLTSRKHIYEAARRRLGQRNLAQFADGSAVVDVGELTFEEKAQILYNHVNFGEQSQSWRSSVKPHLAAVAAVHDFLPGIAERLGDPNFTKGLAPRESSLVRFMQEPTEHLIDTVNALDDSLQAALKLTEKQLASDIRELLSDLLHVPKIEQQALLEKLRLEAKRRTRGNTPGIWTNDDLLATVRAHGGFLASSASLEHFVPPANLGEMVRLLNEKSAVVLRGPSGTGKTQAALKLCDMARRRDGTLEVVTLGADDGPTNARKVVDTGPTIFYIDDPWGQYSLAGGNEAWTEQLPRLLAKAAPGHQFVITTRSDMLHSAGVGGSLDPWSVNLDVEQYRDGQLREIHDNRMDQLPASLQTKAYAFRKAVLDKLETPLQIELYFTHLLAGPEVDEEDHAFFRRLLALAQRDAVEGIVVRLLESIDTSGASAIVWALLAARAQFDRGRLHPLQRSLRALDRALGEDLGKLVDRMVAARHLRQPARTVAFAHPSVQQAFETFASANWLRSEAAIEMLASALVQLPAAHCGWGMETAARVLEVTRTFARRSDIDQPFEVDQNSQAAIDVWLDESLVDPGSKFAPLLDLASEVGTDASIPSRVARWLLKGTQRGASVFIRNWQPPVFDDAWYEVVSADPVAAQVAARFIREELGFDRGNYGPGFAERLDRFAPDLTPAYLDAALQMVGNGFELNADAVALGGVRDLVGFERVVQAALDDLAKIWRRHAQDWGEEWRAIEDGERDHAAEEAAQWNHEGDGYTSGVFIDTYVRRLRAEGRWQVLADHPRVAELVRAWAQALLTSPDCASEGEMRALLTAGKGRDGESNVWAAVRQHWRAPLEPALAERLCAGLLDADIRDELALAALSVAPQALLAAFKAQAGNAERQVMLLIDMQRARQRLAKGGRSAKLKRVTDALSPELAEIFGALLTPKRKARVVGPSALVLLTSCTPKLDAEALDLLVPVILTSGGDASAAIAQWLRIASRKEQAVRATEAAIATDDIALIEGALRHERADARRAALLHLVPNMPDPLPPAILAMAGDPGSRVRRALVTILAERPHPDHLRTLLTLIHDSWSSAEPHHDEADSFDVAQEAVIALAVNEPLSDEVGDALLNLADTTVDRTLSKYALMVAANCCSAGIQQKISNLVNIPEARWIRLDAIDVLAGADNVAPSIVAHLTPAYLLKAPPILAAPAAHLIGAHAPIAEAIGLFERVASSNKRRALLLVGAAAMASRDSEAATRILDLLEPGHLGRQLLSASQPLPASVLDELGTVQLREAVRKRLGDRIAAP